MAKKTKETGLGTDIPSSRGAVDEGQQPAPIAKPERVAKDSVVVRFRDHRGEPTERTYSRDVHGENFAELAEEFCRTNASKIIS